jgi:integrase
MASIVKRVKANGETVYDCSIKIRKHGEVVHREKKSFNKLKLAKDWGMRRETELQEQTVYKKREYLSLGSVIEQYIKEFEPTGRSKMFDLTKLLQRDIAKVNVHTLSHKDLIQHIRERNKECLPQTATNDLIWLGVVLRTMKGIIDLDTDLTIFATAREILYSEGLIAKAHHRSRRPSKKELWDLSKYLHDKYQNVPMLHLMWFAIYSARRQAEIVQLRWEDLNNENRTILVRNLKDPRIKNKSKMARLPRSAYKIILKQPKVSEFIFPYNSKTIGAYFTNSCKMLDITGLHFHDLRHHAVSLLFEKKLSIVEVQQISLHCSWNTLQRYTNLKPEDVDI